MIVNHSFATQQEAQDHADMMNAQRAADELEKQKKERKQASKNPDALSVLTELLQMITAGHGELTLQGAQGIAWLDRAQAVTGVKI